MKKPGKNEIIDLLNDVLKAELAAINQYFLHSSLCQHWGYTKLSIAMRKQSIGEMHHAEAIIERILFLDGKPSLKGPTPIKVGKDVREQLAFDAALENEAVPRLNDGIQLCREAADNATASMLEGLLKSEEEHVDWLETQIELIDTLGKENYLAQQI